MGNDIVFSIVLFGFSWISANVIFSQIFFVNQTLLFACFVAAEFLALCPSGIGTSVDGRGNFH